MRPAAAVIALLLGSACAVRSERPRWETAYWYWQHAPRAVPVESSERPDLVYVQVGTLSAPGLAASRWPARVPPARAYVATWRSDEAAPPSSTLAPVLAESYQHVAREAARAGIEVSGLQLDVDCPTRRLDEYATFLRAVRREIPAATLSITALLDWFGRRTSVADVVAAVDEYVPQFYDVRPPDQRAGIAEPIDLLRWRPTFESLGKKYRVGIASFGRVQRAAGTPRVAYRDASLLSLWGDGMSLRKAESNESGETVLRLEGRGRALEAVLPTPESVGRAIHSVRELGGSCVGVAFFRWPSQDESLILTPDEIASDRRPIQQLAVQDGFCAPRACADLRLTLGDRFAKEPTVVTLVASGDIEYVVAAAGVRLRQTSAREVEVTVPAFAGSREASLGRAFSRSANDYRIGGFNP